MFWEMDFPMAVFSGQHVFSQRLTAGKHMASFQHAVATCVTDRPWKYKDCKWSYTENTQRAVSLFTFSLFAFGSRSHFDSRKDLLHLDGGLQEAFNARVSTKSYTVLLF